MHTLGPRADRSEGRTAAINEAIERLRTRPEWLTPWVLSKDGQWTRCYRIKQPFSLSSLLPGTVCSSSDSAWVYGVVAGPKVDPHRVQVEIECDRLKGILFAATGNEGQRGITEADRERDTYYAIPIRHRCDSRFHGNWFVNR